MLEGERTGDRSEDSAESNWPPTVIVVHPKERRSKCSVEPLRGWDGFEFVDWSPNSGGKNPIPKGDYLRLGIGGPLLTPADRSRGLLVLDATWRLAAKMETDYGRLPIRSLPPWETAYPRISRTGIDPTGGLATIEAIYAAYVALDRPVAGLLNDYHWAEEFLKLNAKRLPSGEPLGSRR